MLRAVVIVIGLSLLPWPSWAQEPVLLQDPKAREGYSLGYDFGNNIKRQGIDVDKDAILSAVRDGLEGRKPAMSPDEIRDTLLRIKRTLVARQDRHLGELAAKNLKAEEAFMAMNRTREGVKVLPSGLQYKVLCEGAGQTPKATDTVTLNYRGTLIDGTEFDSSYGRGEPSTVHVIGVIQGWAEALQLMKTGAKWQLFIPAKLAYGDRQFGRIPPNSTLIFDLELLSIAQGLSTQAEDSAVR